MKYFTMQEVITLLRISKNTLINWEESGRIPPARRQPVSGYRIWTEEELEVLKKLSKEVKGRYLDSYRGIKFYVHCPKEEHWKYQILYFIYGKTELKSKMITSRNDFATKEEAIKRAKEIIDRLISKK